MQLRQLHRVPTPRASLHTPSCYACVSSTCAPFAATRCFFYVLTLCVQLPLRSGGVGSGVASWPVWPYQVKLMSLVPMLAAAYVAAAAASAATHASWRCWRAMAMGDTPALMKELGEVVCAVRCAGGSGMQRAGPVILHRLATHRTSISETGTPISF